MHLTDETPTKATEKLLAVIKCLKTEVAKTHGDFWKGLATFILNKCNLVIISTDVLDMSYKLFKSVNNVGVPLDFMAIARAELLGRQVNNNQICQEISRAWDDVEVKLGSESLQGYIMTVALLVNPECDKGDPVQAIRAIASSAHFSAEFNTKLRDFLLAYSALDNATIDFGPDSPQINRLVACILNTPFDDWRTAALFWLTQSKSAPESYKFFGALDGLCVGLSIPGITTNAKRAKRFEAIVQAIKKGTVLKTISSPIYLTDEERSKIKAKLDTPMKGKTANSFKPLLLRLNAEVAARETPLQFPENVEIEHVLPQKPKAGAWRAHFPDENERERLTYLLGNLALLTPSTNKKATNLSFTDKKTKIFSMSQNNCFALTANIAAYPEWTPEVIRHRHNELKQHAKNIMAL